MILGNQFGYEKITTPKNDIEFFTIWIVVVN